ncbi:MAG: glycosyltransferase family 2 protein [Lachnospiraceae bacterium]|nr:glycosyltransferase family 2 protein [Lachnospiraceae bacterium]
MHDNVLISVIIPHYNSPDKLERLLKSIAGEAGLDIQIIVVDDRSDKECEKLAEVRKKYGTRVEFYRNNKGIKGAGTARNIGLRHAVGRWLAFADADDYFTRDAWKIIGEACNTSSADIIYFYQTSVIEGTDVESDRHLPFVEMVRNYCENRNRKTEMELRVGFTSPCAKVIRRDVVSDNNIRFDQIPISNDIMFSLKTAIAAESIEAREEVVYCVTKEPGSLSYNTGRWFVDQRLKAALNKLKYLRKHVEKNDLRLLDLSGSRYFREAVVKGYSVMDIIRWMMIFVLNGFLPFELKYAPEIISGLLKRRFEFMRRDDWKIWKRL